MFIARTTAISAWFLHIVYQSISSPHTSIVCLREWVDIGRTETCSTIFLAVRHSESQNWIASPTWACGCRTVDVACRHVWKLRLHFIFCYLMRHESYERRTTDAAVCERARSVRRTQPSYLPQGLHPHPSGYNRVREIYWTCSVASGFPATSNVDNVLISNVGEVAATARRYHMWQPLQQQRYRVVIQRGAIHDLGRSRGYSDWGFS
jgi:hypothetical protein